MSNIEEMQGRIMAAMERASRGLEKLAASQEAGPDHSQELEEERLANAQLTERVKKLKARLDTETMDMQAKLIAAQTLADNTQAKLDAAEAKLAQTEQAEARMRDLDVELQRVRRANAELSDACTALREANAEGVGDPDLINKAMQAELDALRAARKAETAEADAILHALSPLVQSQKDQA